MGTGPPAFTEVDNPASFAKNVFFRVSCSFGIVIHVFWFLSFFKTRL